MSHVRARRWRRAVLITVTVVSVAYAPIAMTALWPYADPGAPSLGPSLLSRAVSPSYVADALATRIRPYRHSLVPLVVHSVLGGLLMLLGPAQLISAVRRRVRLHRALGVLYVVTVYGAMAGAAVYLARTAPEDAFSGPVFWIVLATILLGTVMSVTLGVPAALRGFPDLHQRWLLLNYGFLMTAPLLRFEWGALPLLLPGTSLAEVNRVAVMHLGSLVAFGALLASRALDRRKRIPGLTGSWVPWPVLVAVHAAGIAALGWIVPRFAHEGAHGFRLLLGYLVPLAAVYAVLLYKSVTTRGWPREEWRIHLAAVCVAPVVSVALSVPFAAALDLDRTTALSAGVAVGCGITAFYAVLVVNVRLVLARRTVRGRSTPTLGAVRTREPERAAAPEAT